MKTRNIQIRFRFITLLYLAAFASVGGFTTGYCMKYESYMQGAIDQHRFEDAALTDYTLAIGEAGKMAKMETRP